MANYFTDEQGYLVVPLEYSELKEVRLCQPKGKHVKAIQKKAKEHYPDLDDITMMQIAVQVLSKEPLTIEQLDELDAIDMVHLGEALGQFNFFRQMQARV